MKRTLVVVSLVLAVAASACGGSDKKSGTSASSTVAPLTTATPGPTYTGDKNSKFCRLGAEFSQRFSNLNSSLTAGPDRARSEMAALKGVIEDAKAAAPSAIKSDVDTLATAFDQFFADVQAGNFDPQAVSSATSKLATPDVQRAAQHLQAYGQQVCGLDSSGTTP